MTESAAELLMMANESQQQRLDVVEEEGKYGWKYFTPRCLQVLNRPKWALLFISGVAFNQGMVTNGLLHLFVPHIERRFELSSSESSYIINAFDIGSLLFLLPITYLGSRPGAHRPHFIGHGAVILGTGSLVFSLPAFLTGPYNAEVITNLCLSNPPIFDREPIPNGTILYILLFFGNFLHGIGSVPLTTLSLTYLDDSVPPSKSWLYIGVFYGSCIMGPAVGIGLGALFSEMNVDFLRHLTIPEDEWLTPDSPRWVGCWWLGFVLFGLVFYPLGTMVLGLPRYLKGTKKLIDLKKIQSREETMALSTVQVPEIRSFQTLPQTLWFVIRNLRFDLLTIAGCCELMLITGLGTHFPKLLEQQFKLGPKMVSICFGAITVPPCLLGLCIGGYIMRIYQLELKGTLLLCTCLMSVAMLIIPGVCIHCPDRSNSVMVDAMVSRETNSDRIRYLEVDCNKDCHCDATLISPVCGSDDVEYFSPCYAGCESEQSIDNVKFYNFCKCINVTDSSGFQAKHGHCPRGCALLYIFLVGVFFYQTITFTGGVPALTASLRCNDIQFRSLGLALQWMAARVLGAIPGPIMFGKLIDASCVLWNSAKGVRGNCLVYDHWGMGWRIACACFAVKSFQAFVFFMAYLLERRRLKKLEHIVASRAQSQALSVLEGTSKHSYHEPKPLIRRMS